METSTGRCLPRVMVDNVFLAPVHINAGGTVYTTTLDTLTKFPESKLAKLFDGTLAISIDPMNRQYFLDVNGSVFAHILDFLRYGELLLPEDFTQLPLLTKLADYFEIQDMIQTLVNMGGEERSRTEGEGKNVDKQLKKIHRNRKYLGTRSNSGSHETQSNSLETEKVKYDNAIQSGKMSVGTCELGIVKLGILEGGKVDLGTIESATMKGKKLEAEILAAKTIETEKISAGNIESEVMEVKSTKVEVLKAEQLKSETVEMDKVKAGHVKMQTVDAGLTNVEMLETRAIKSQTVEMGIVNAANVEIKSLESETLKLKTLEVGTLTANVCSLPTKPKSVKLDAVNSESDFVLVQLDIHCNILFFATDSKLDMGKAEKGYHELSNSNGYKCFFYSKYNESIWFSPTQRDCFEHHLLKIFQTLIKKGYKLWNVTAFGAENKVREYVFCT